MNSKQRQRREYLLRKGYHVPPPDPVEIKRTEDGIVYKYHPRFVIPFTKWASQQRDQNAQPLFKNFYDQLTEDERKEIIMYQLNQIVDLTTTKNNE